MPFGAQPYDENYYGSMKISRGKGYTNPSGCTLNVTGSTSTTLDGTISLSVTGVTGGKVEVTAPAGITQTGDYTFTSTDGTPLSGILLFTWTSDDGSKVCKKDVRIEFNYITNVCDSFKLYSPAVAPVGRMIPIVTYRKESSVYVSLDLPLPNGLSTPFDDFKIRGDVAGTYDVSYTANSVTGGECKTTVRLVFK